MKDFHGKNARRGVRDYSRRSYGNPLFSGQQKKRRARDPRRIKAIAIGVLILALILLTFWYLFWGQAFRISNVSIEGATADTSTEIRGMIEERLKKRWLLVMPQSSIFIFDTDESIGDIESRFYLEQLELRKKLPGTISVNVREREMVGAFLARGQFLAIDAEGYVIRELTKRERVSLVDLPDGFEGVAASELGAESVNVVEIDQAAAEQETAKKNSNPLPLILDWEKVGDNYHPGSAAVSNEMLRLVLQANAQLPDVSDSGIRWFALDSAADTVDVMLKGGWHVYLTTLIPFDVQASRLSLVLKEKIGDRRDELEYVDLRYDERIFFRFIGEVN
ncbi:MAG: hypothetical protein ABIJ46_03715 [bacterium]